MSAAIDNLPEAVIEYIFSYLSPYKDLKQCMLVNKAWAAHVKATVRKLQRDFHNAITSRNITWRHYHAEGGPTISRRYSHSACSCGESMYVFGGCTTANTTFNDLWRLDLATRCWIRPLATGTYPPPKACATMVCYQNSLILFGGWTHTSPYPLQQNWHIFNHLHIYNTTSNRWNHVVTSSAYPGMAGHTASVIGDKMIVFGGLHCNSGWGPFSSSNEVWILDLKTMAWNKQQTTSPAPHARYSHSQIVVDDTHLLIFGGCGGPNMLFSDIWLLTVNDDPNSVWEWQEIDILQKENAAPHLSFHPACKVGNRVVILSKSQWSRTSPSCLPLLLRGPSRTWVPPRADAFARPEPIVPLKQTDKEHCVNGRKGVLKRQLGRLPQAPASNNASSSDEEEINTKFFYMPCSSGASPEKDSASHGLSTSECEPPKEPQKIDCTKESSSSSPTDCHMRYMTSDPVPDRNSTPHNISTGQSLVSPNLPKSSPSIRPNARRNRQRQLEGLDRMEQKLRNLRNRPPEASERQRAARPGILSWSPNDIGSQPTTTKNSMCLYVVDITQVVKTRQVTWIPPQIESASGLEEIILYSLVPGRGELVMFGGIQKDVNSNQQENEKTPQVVSNSLHFISAQRAII